MILCVPKETTHKFGDKPWLGFECVTMVPMCKKLIDVKLLTEEERNWVNDYHVKVMEKIGGRFENDERTRRWLERECAPL